MKKRTGRPPLPPDEKRRPPMGFRPTIEVRHKLEEAARQSGRSLSREVEDRLERSFLSEEAHHETFGGAEAYRLVRLLALLANEVSEVTGKPWTSDIETFETAQGAWTFFARAFVGGSVMNLDSRPAQKGYELMDHQIETAGQKILHERGEEIARIFARATIGKAVQRDPVD